MKSEEYRSSEDFLRNRQFMVGDFDMPFVYSQEVITDDLHLIAFSNIKTEEDSETTIKKTVHFFLDDYKFDEVWKEPDWQLKRLSQYAQLLSPGFSLYSDMPEPLQIYNTFRNRWCASYWQYNKQLVIPTVVWGDQKTFDFCFDGIEKGCAVAVSTVGAMDDEEEFKAGYLQMCKTIEPELILNYGSEFSWMKDCSPILTIPYKHGSRHKADKQ